MKRQGPDEEACGVWLDAAALKRRKVQTHLLKPSTKLLTLFPGERKPSISFTQRRIPSAGSRQTSIASFVTLKPGMKNGSDQKSVSSQKESQSHKKPEKDAIHPDHLVQGLDGDCPASPLATSTPADIQEAGLFLRSLQTSGHHSVGTPLLTMLSLPPSDIQMCAGESQASLDFPFNCNTESSCLLDHREDKNSPRKTEWLHGSKTNCPGKERHIKALGGRCHQPLDKTELGTGSDKENRQTFVQLQTYRELQSAKRTLPVKGSPRPRWARGKNDKDSYSQLFTEDSEGQQVIAHGPRAPFQDVSSGWNQDSEQVPDGPRVQCQAGLTKSHLQPDLLFTQDSEGNQVIRHQF